MKVLPLLLLLTAPILLADLPNAIPQQGRVAVDGANVDGSGQFKFLLFGDEDQDHASGNETAVWSNAESAPATTAEPLTAVALPVSKGLYSLWLGDTTLANMAALPTEFDPSDAELYLRIWFSDGVNGFQQLSPDQPIGSVPYALLARSAAFANRAETSQSVEARAIRSVHIEDGSILGSDLATGAVTGNEVLDGSLQLADLDLASLATTFTPQNAQTIVVDAGGGAAFTTISDAVAFVNPTAANPVIIEVRPGIYTESVVLKSHLHLRGAGRDSTTIIPPATSPADSVALRLTDLAGVRISGFTFRPPLIKADAGIRDLRSSPVIHDCRFLDFNSNFGNDDESGGVVSSGSDPVIARCEFDTELHGIVLREQSRAVITACEFGEASDLPHSMTGVLCLGSDCRVINNSFSTHGAGVLLDCAVPGGFTSKAVISGNHFFGVATGVEIDFRCHATITSNHFEGDDSFNRGVFNGGSVAVTGNTFLNLEREAVFSDGSAATITGNHIENCGTSGGRDALTVPEGQATVSGNNFVSNAGDLSPFPHNVSLTALDTLFLEADPGSGLLAGPRLGVGPSPFEPTVEFEVRGQSLFAGEVRLQDELSVSGKTILSDDVLMPGAVQIRELLISEDITQVQNIISSGVVGAGAFRYSTTRTFTYNVPGNALIPSRESEDFFHSSLGYVRIEGADNRFIGTAPVRLPEGARITGYDLMYFDNSAAQSFTNFTTRLRRRGHLNPSTQNIAVLDVIAPASPNNSTIKIESDNPGQFVSSAATVDNDNFAYFATIDFQVTGNDADRLRCYGFRIRYRLDDLLP